MEWQGKSVSSMEKTRTTQSASHVTDYVCTCLLTVTAQTRYREDGGTMSFRNADLHQRVHHRHQHHRRENLRAHTAGHTHTKRRA
jgi:hypothetical protein